MTTAVNSYVLITTARNEALHIEKTLDSVASQTLPPRRWNIVSDGSSDGTDDIIKRYAARYPWIGYFRREAGIQRSFASKVYAFQLGVQQLTGVDYAYIGNQDADCSFSENYYQQVLEMFAQNPRLGIGGGVCYELFGEKWLPMRTSVAWSVVGAIQMFRRQCYEEVKGYQPLQSGGIDTLAEIMARMHGWEVKANPNLVVRHHRRMGCGKQNIYRARFRQGTQEFLMGNDPCFEMVKAASRVSEPPYFIGSLFRLAGYVYGSLRGLEKAVPQEVVRFSRMEQRQRLLRFVQGDRA